MCKVSGAYIQTATFSMQGLMTLDLAVTVVQLSSTDTLRTLYTSFALREAVLKILKVFGQGLTCTDLHCKAKEHQVEFI